MRDYREEINRSRLLLSFLNLTPDAREIAQGHIVDCLWQMDRAGTPHPDAEAIEQEIRDDDTPTYRLW